MKKNISIPLSNTGVDQYMSFYYTDLLLEAGGLLVKAKTETDIFEILIEYANTALHPDLTCFYLKDETNTRLKIDLKRGFPKVPENIHQKTELVSFLSESKKLVCINTQKQSPFEKILLTSTMNSGMAISIFIKKIEYGVLFVNSVQPYFFKKREILFLENLTSILSGTELVAWS